jgi:hypothetical protein
VQYNNVDAGYRATDEVFNHVFLHENECKWISLTAVDNSYGSEVCLFLVTYLEKGKVVVNTSFCLPTGSRKSAS